MATHESRTMDQTTAELRDTPPRDRGRWLRWAGAGLLWLVVLLAAVDLLGPRSGETSSEGGGYTLHVGYAQITRAGQPAPLDITVTAAGGFEKTLQLRLCDELFDDLDFQSWYPTPAAETGSPPWLIYEFDTPPSGDTFELSLDARVAPGQFGELEECEIAVLVEDVPVTSTSFTVWRMP